MIGDGESFERGRCEKNIIMNYCTQTGVENLVTSLDP